MKDLFESTNWIGYGAALLLVLVSVGAALYARTPASPRLAVQLPPIVAADVRSGFVGEVPFGLWTLVCQNLPPRDTALLEGEAPPQRLCRTNARATVRGPNSATLVAAGFNVVMMDTKPMPAIVFRLPPSARAAETANFAIDNNPMFEAPLRCSDKECLVQGALPQDALEQMRKGRMLSVIYTVKDLAQQDKKVRVDQLLHGFRQSYDAMARAIS